MWHSCLNFRDFSIRTKVMLVTLAASLVALFAVAGGLYVFQLQHFRDTFQKELRTIAKIMADNSATAVAFNDRKTASEIIAPLSAEREILGAWVLGGDGQTMAVFGPAKGRTLPMLDVPAGLLDRGDTWTVVEPIFLDGERIGTFLLDANYARPRGELQRMYLGVTASVLGGSLGLVVLLTMRLQRFITGPLQRLAHASESVARDHDYSVRVASLSRDEIGQLTNAFNHMLARIEEQDAALHLARGDLQTKVTDLEMEIGERERAQAAQARLTAIIEATPEFVGSMDPDGRMIYLNRGARRMLGLAEDFDLSSAALTLTSIHPSETAEALRTEGLPEAARNGYWAAEDAVLLAGDREIQVAQLVIAHRDRAGELEYFSTVIRDVSERKAAEEHLADLNKQLVDTSRQAGMAEVATGVLHNVGNVLNSINIAASTVIEKLRVSKVQSLAKAAELLRVNEGNLAAFLTGDPQGQRLPGFLRKLASFLGEENELMRGELAHLARNVEHIKEIVAMQQSYARATGFLEDVPGDKLVEDALQLNSASFARHGIEVARSFDSAPAVRVDKHKVLQILINLLRNAKHAVEDAARPDPQIDISIDQAGDALRIAVSDNGVGIAEQNLTSVFRHGFTTKKNGHGFGLHSGANAAREMGGTLTATSRGPGLGATFTLELPIATPHLTS